MPTTAASVPPFSELAALPGWRTVDFISDLHLQASEPATFNAFASYARSSTADALLVLGDFFEVWAGDDTAAADPFSQACADALRSASAHMAVYFMHGNRDFLVGEAFLAACQVTFLPDPTVLTFGGARWLLTHGDALCLDDVDYLTFRAEVRSPAWQKAFLAQTLGQRQAIARRLRETSELKKRSGVVYADLDQGATRAWLAAADSPVMIHGHTHRPAEHDLGPRTVGADYSPHLQRIVLSDWDAAARPPRLEVLRLQLPLAAAGSAPALPQRITLP